MVRQTGTNYLSLKNKLEKVEDYVKGLEFVSGTENFESFETQFMLSYDEFDKEFDMWAR